MSRQQAAPAPELDDQPVASRYRLQQFQHPGRAVVCVEAEAEVMDRCEVAPVVGHIRWIHRRILAHWCPLSPATPGTCHDDQVRKTSAAVGSIVFFMLAPGVVAGVIPGG